MIQILVITLVFGMLINVGLKMLHAARNKKYDNPQDSQGKPKPERVPKFIIELYQTGYDYETGFKGMRSLDKAVEFYTLAAEKNYAPAQYKLAQIYSKGKDFPLDMVKARYWAVEACKQDYPGSDALYSYIEDKERLLKEKLEWEAKSRDLTR